MNFFETAAIMFNSSGFAWWGFPCSGLPSPSCTVRVLQWGYLWGWKHHGAEQRSICTCAWTHIHISFFPPSVELERKMISYPKLFSDKAIRKAKEHVFLWLKKSGLSILEKRQISREIYKSTKKRWLGTDYSLSPEIKKIGGAANATSK